MSFFFPSFSKRKANSSSKQRGGVSASGKLRRDVFSRALRLEPLENRTLLAVFAVTNTNDSGDGSLRWAITQANQTVGADTVEISAALAGQTVRLTSGQLNITDTSVGGTTTIKNLGTTNVVVDGNYLSRVFYIATNASAEISGLSISRGYANDYGGGIYNNGGTLTLTACLLLDNHGRNGGALCNNGVNATLTNCTLSNNSAENGGGIWSKVGTSTLTACVISNNSATNGAGIYNSGGTLLLTNNTISNNSATTGGGIYNIGTLSIFGGTLSGNNASSYGRSIYCYGGEYNIGNDAVITNSLSNIADVYLYAGNLTIANGKMSITGNLYVEPYSTVTVAADGIFDFAGDGAVLRDLSTSGNLFTNYGTLLKSSGTSTSYISCGIYNLGGTVDVRSGTLVFDGISTGANIHVDSGATLLIAYGATWTGTYNGTGTGSVVLQGRLTIGDGGAVFNFSEGLFQWQKGLIEVDSLSVLTNIGYMTFLGVGEDICVPNYLIVDNQGTISQRNSHFRFYGMLLLNNTNGHYNIEGNASISGIGPFTNRGTVRVSAGSSTVTIASIFNNEGGTIDVESGTLIINNASDSVSTGATIAVDSGATLQLINPGTWTGVYNGTGAGNVIFGGGSTKALVIGNAGATFNFTEGLFQWKEGHIQADTSATSAAPAILTNTGYMTLGAYGSKYLDGFLELDNQGTIFQKDCSLNVLYILRNNTKGIYDFQGAADLWGGTFTNLGMLKKSAGTESVIIQAAVDNIGNVEVDSGMLDIYGVVAQVSDNALTGGTWNVQNSSTLRISSVGNLTSIGADVTLSGAGATFTNLASLARIEATGSLGVLDGATLTTVGDLLNCGSLTVGLGSAISVGGNYTQTDNAALTTQIGGASSSGLFGRLNITGTAALDGTLDVVLADDYHPAGPDTYKPMTFAGVSGDFSTANVPTPEGSLFFLEEINADNVTLEVVADDIAPIVTISSPSRNITAHDAVTYTITYADAYFNTSTLALADITLNTTGTATGTVGLLGSGTTYTVTISNITGDGTLGITVAAGTATDAAGNLAPEATSKTFLVDHTAPTVTLSVSRLVNVSMLSGSGTATDSGSGVADGTTAYLDVDVNNDGDFTDVVDIRSYVVGVLSGGKLAVTTPTIPDGTYRLRTHVSDAAGNEGFSATSIMTVSTHPAISKIVVTAKTSADKTTITWNEAGGSNTLGKATLTIDGKAVSVTQKSTGKTTATFSYAGVLTAGKHTYTITGTDSKGQKSSYTDTFTVAATTPVISKVSTKATTSDKATTISWTVADIDGVGKVQVSIDGGAAITIARKSGSATSANFVYSGMLTAGPHTFKITAVDATGKAAVPYSGSLKVTPTTPTIKNVKVTAKTSGDNTVIAWTVYDYDKVKSTTLRIDGVKMTSGITQSGSGATINYTYAGKLTAGKHTYTIDATDAAVVSASAKQTKGSFTVAATVPTISGVKITATTVKTTIAWNAYDIDRISGYKLTIDGKTITSGIAQSGSGTTFAYTYTGVLKAGSHSYAITATDSQKKSSTASGKFTVTVASSAASMVFATVGAAAKTDWLIDYDSILSTDEDDIVDAVFA